MAYNPGNGCKGAMVDVNDIAALAAQIRQGDTEAFRSLVRTLSEPLYRFALKATCDSEQAQDVVQRAFVRVWNSRARLNAGAELRGYCYRVTINLARNAIRDE
ncbi:partial RNA polymerase sigma-H factor, partial [uncultured bacterium]